MPRSTVKLDKALVSRFVLWLQKENYEVDTSRDNFRALMYRREELSWTQGHDGLTRYAKTPRSFLRFSGPEETAVAIFKTEFDEEQRS